MRRVRWDFIAAVVLIVCLATVTFFILDWVLSTPAAQVAAIVLWVPVLVAIHDLDRGD